MNIIVKARNFELTGAIESFVQKKMTGLKKFMKAFEGHHLPVPGGKNLFDVMVDIGKETNRHKKGEVFVAEARIYLPGKNLFVKEVSENIQTAVSEVRDELETEIRKYKSKIVEFPVRKAKQLKQEI